MNDLDMIKPVLFISIILFATINIIGAEKSDAPSSADAPALHEIVIPISPHPILTPGIVCRNLHSDKDFELLVKTMTDKVIASLKTKLPAERFLALNPTSIADDIRQDLIDIANEKATVNLTARRLVRLK
jgi:hypothetical protein